MEHKQFRKAVAEATGRTSSDTDALIEALAVVLRRAGSDLDAVAVPSFGTFAAVKYDEEIQQDLSTGQNILLPPEIKLEFNPSAALMRKISPADKVIPDSSES